MSQNSRMWMVSPNLSLSDLLGKEYTDAVCEARAFVQGVDKKALIAIADEPVDFFPRSFQERMDELVDLVGQTICNGLPDSAPGAGTASYVRAASNHMAPLTGFGFVRIGEDGKAYLATKAEHYHLSVGHSFPGYQLVENARRLGIPNATHNNTRGHATRTMEQELVRVINGIEKGDKKGLRQVIDSTEPHVLNRVLNMETGSLVVEAALKMVLSRFFRFDERFDEPQYADRIPVLLVVGDNAGGTKANYHGTTILTQIMRGAWAGLDDALKSSDGLVVRPVKINDIEDFERVLSHIPKEAGKLVVVDGVFSMEGDLSVLPELAGISEKYGARIMVDDAHGLGVMGEHGRGTAEHFGLEDKVSMVMGTLSSGTLSFFFRCSMINLLA